MFFFFFGGIQPKIRQTLERSFDKCIIPRCPGRMDLVEVSQTLSVFFLPVWSWGTPQTMIHCQDCQVLMDVETFQQRKQHSLLTQQSNEYSHVTRSNTSCHVCNAPLRNSWSFCPKCGAKKI